MEKLIDVECSQCEHFELDVWRERGAYGTCGKCSSPMVRAYRSFGAAIGDDIPGGLLVPHAVCNADGTPKRYYTKSDIAKAAKAAGWTNRVEHVTPQGSDKAKYTSRWT